MNRANEIEFWRYNCRDSVATWEIDDEQMRRVGRMDQKRQNIVKFQNDLFWPLWRMSQRGIRIDLEKRDEIRKQLVQFQSDRQYWIESCLGHQINLSSPQQVQHLFYDDFKQPPIRRFKQGKWVNSCDDKALESIAEKEPLLRQFVKNIQEHRSCGRILETFIDGAELRDGRICCHYDITGTKTDRFAHKKTIFGYGTNLGNIPANSKPAPGELLLPNVREMFIPDEGMTYFDVDLDSADLNIVAWESGCQELKDMILGGFKVYVEIAKEYYHDQTINKEHWAYKLFKSLCHGTNYLGQAAGLARRLGLSVYEVGKIQKWYFKRFPEIQTWQKSVIKQINERGWIENVFGRRCYFLGKISDKSYREGIAWIPQSTVARIIDIGLVRIDALEQNESVPIYLLNQVHDSLDGEYPTDLEESLGLKKKIIECCSVELPYADPRIIPADIHTSVNNWAECK